MRKPKHEDQKSVTVGTVSLDAMWADLAKRAAVKEPPRGARSVYDFAKLANQSVPSARYFLNQEVEAGRMESGNYSVAVNGQKHTVKLYTPVSS